MPTPLRLLHIDDEPLALDMVRDILAGEMVVDNALTLQSAREQLAIQTYDILLVDLMLGDSCGVSTVEALHPYGIPLVVLSAVEDPEVLASVGVAGAEDYILKGVLTPRRLINRLRFAHARYLKRVEYEKGEAVRRAVARKQYLGGSTFESLKPFISCAGLTAGSRGPFGMV